jgi:phage terminase large subunit-like protein
LRRFDGVYQPGLHAGQRAVVESPARFRVVACGRRWGKTEAGKAILVQAVAAGRRGWWLAPTHAMAGHVWADLRRMGQADRVRVVEAERRIELAEGGMLAVRSAFHPDRLRGEGLDLVILDEAAYMPARLWPEVIRPMLAISRGQAVFLSTPFGRNHFWTLYQLGLDPLEPDWQSFHFPTAANPMIAPAELAAIQRQTPEHVWRTEYEAEFVDHAGQVFRGLDGVMRAPLHPVPLYGHQYVAGVDWGRDHDYTAIIVMDADTQAMVAMDRFNQNAWAVQRGRVAQMAAEWEVTALWAESNSMGVVNSEALREEGLPVRDFATTVASKGPLIDGLALAIERGHLTLQDDPVLRAELLGYRMRPMAGGGFRYSAPAGGHDDTVIALALAWHGVQQGRVRIRFG